MSRVIVTIAIAPCVLPGESARVPYHVQWLLVTPSDSLDVRGEHFFSSYYDTAFFWAANPSGIRKKIEKKLIRTNYCLSIESFGSVYIVEKKSFVESSPNKSC
jgi:hypothetical protein